MPNNDAIKWLESIDKKYIHGGDEWYDEQRHEAIKTAIKALEREVDLEQAVVNIKMSDEEIKQFKQMLHTYTSLYTITNDTFVEGASVERSQSDWISISDRLPEKNGNYLCTVDYGEDGIEVEERNYRDTLGGFDKRYNKNDKVIAWMPKPEPYKEEAEE